jgi:UDP-glucose:(heptosyl)LPS alpha-1,3-glucosyltransferase
MRIALVILHAEPSRGGAEHYTHDLAGALAQAGHEVSLLATSFDEVPRDVRAVTLGAGGPTRTSRYLRMLGALEREVAARAGRPDAFDIVHAMLPVRRCDVYHPHAGLAVDAVGRWGELTWLANPRRALFARVERELLGLPDGPVVLCLSDIVRAAVREKYPQLGDDRLATLFNAVDLAKFDPQRPDVTPWTSAAVPSGTPVLAMVAQDFARKGVATAIDALARLNQTMPAEAHRPMLVIAGGDRPDRYVRQAQARGVADRVVFTGAMADVRPLYKAAWALVLPTRHDPCSLVVLEALAMGVPVISTRMNGACQIMRDGHNGYVLDRADDAELLALRLRSLLDPAVRTAMAQSALALRPGLAFENHVHRLLEVYRARLAAAGNP